MKSDNPHTPRISPHGDFWEFKFEESFSWDCGASVKSGFKKVASAAASTLTQAWNLGKEIGVRWFGLFDFILTFLGIQLPKKLRLRVKILRDETDKPLVSEAVVTYAINEAIRIFSRETNTSIVGAYGDVLGTMGGRAPRAALDVGCGSEAWGEEFGEAGEYFRLHTVINASGQLLGYATPVTAFVVIDVNATHDEGCSLGPLVDYVTVDLSGLHGHQPRVLAHEIGHACGLWHTSGGDLMTRGNNGDYLKRWQKAIFRNSRHVTFL